MEDFHVVNSAFHRSLYMDGVETGGLPLGVVSARDLEGLVTLADVSVGAFLRDLATERNRHPDAGLNVRAGLPGHTHRRNEVIEQAWGVGVWTQLIQEQQEQDTAGGNDR